MGRYLSTLKSPLDPLAAWTTTSDTPHVLQASGIVGGVRAERGRLRLQQPNSGSEAALERAAAATIASHVPIDQPDVAFVASTVEDAMATLGGWPWWRHAGRR